MSVITIGALKGKFETGDRPYGSDFDKVHPVTFEDDRVHGFYGLHAIRSNVEYQIPDYDQILGKELAARFKGQELW